MNQTKQREFLIDELLKEQPDIRNTRIPDGADEQWRMLRSLMNIRMPGRMKEEFLHVQDEYLAAVNEAKGIVTLGDMDERETDLYIWKGDITRLGVGAIVNAANSRMTGCYQACHNCIDNIIHTYAGVQLRNYCDALMRRQGHEEPTGQAKITPGFNLPCDYVIHTVGPIVTGSLTSREEDLLRSCYNSCLELADANDISSIVFCCISTGVFNFPNERAAEIAVETVRAYKAKTGSRIQVVFNVFKDEDEEIYEKLVG